MLEKGFSARALHFELGEGGKIAEADTVVVNSDLNFAFRRRNLNCRDSLN